MIAMIIVGSTVIVTVALIYGSRRWESSTAEMHAKLEAARRIGLAAGLSDNGFSANATLQDGETAVTLLFCFDENGLIESARAEARGRTVAGVAIPTPWECRWSKYELRDAMCIPTGGEVAWLLPEGPQPYFRGRITSLSYEFAQ